MAPAVDGLAKRLLLKILLCFIFLQLTAKLQI